jgi:Raf kinase inhibitor-like YbhB/YbcL family protein
MPASAYLAAVAAVLAAHACFAMTLSSSDIRPNGPIAEAQIYPRCGGQNISPQLAWSGSPGGTKSLVLTMIDEDVKPAGWSHWLVVDLPPSSTGLPRGVKTLLGAAKGVASDFGEAAYAGPCPPKGSGVHHYRLTIWAMPRATTALKSGGGATAVEADLKGRALGSASLIGTAER